ncbi:MAG TPA: tetratricopeptide repeat protein [Kofleriaceae bacterium]
MPTSISQRLAWLGLVLVLAPGAALADKNDDAKAHVAKASQAHKEGRYEEARAELEAAYALAPNPQLLYALGQVQTKLGNCQEATGYFQRFVATQNDPQIAKVVDQAIAACKPAAHPVAPDTAPPAPASASTPAPAPAQRESAWYQDKLGDSLVLGGVALVVVGLVESRGALSDLDTAGDRGSTTTLMRYHDLVGDAHDKRTASIVLVGAGSLLIAGGVARYVLHGRGAEVRDVGVAPARGGGVVTYGGRF